MFNLQTIAETLHANLKVPADLKTRLRKSTNPEHYLVELFGTSSRRWRVIAMVYPHYLLLHNISISQGNITMRQLRIEYYDRTITEQLQAHLDLVIGNRGTTGVQPTDDG